MSFDPVDLDGLVFKCLPSYLALRLCSSVGFSEPQGEGLGKDITFRAEHSLVSDSLNSEQLCLQVNYLLQEADSLMRVSLSMT